MNAIIVGYARTPFIRFMTTPTVTVDEVFPVGDGGGDLGIADRDGTS